MRLSSYVMLVSLRHGWEVVDRSIIMGDNIDNNAYIHTWVHGEVTCRAYHVCFRDYWMLHHMTLFWLTVNHGGFAGAT